MIAELMVQPSYWIDREISIQRVRNLYLFKFTENLQARLEELAERKKANLLTSEEVVELASLLELDRIFTLINAKVIAASCP
ncbi:hypothetical protein QUB63_29235 [Microcoleus sp. ARI1-B5]|uniref:hypothetical protein n=1 Tax=unclassified Microcoleus TaxID=2642155 RepID=UPI002FD560E4